MFIFQNKSYVDVIPSAIRLVLSPCFNSAEQNHNCLLSTLHSLSLLILITRIIMAEKGSHLNNALVANYLKKVSPEIASEFQV